MSWQNLSCIWPENGRIQNEKLVWVSKWCTEVWCVEGNTHTAETETSCADCKTINRHLKFVFFKPELRSPWWHHHDIISFSKCVQTESKAFFFLLLFSKSFAWILVLGSLIVCLPKTAKMHVAWMLVVSWQQTNKDHMSTDSCTVPVRTCLGRALESLGFLSVSGQLTGEGKKWHMGPSLSGLQVGTLWFMFAILTPKILDLSTNVDSFFFPGVQQISGTVI